MTSTPKRHGNQFSLGRMLLLVTLLCLGPGGYMAYEQQEARRQDAAEALLNELRGTQAYIRPHWLRKWIDGPAVGYAVGLAILSPQATDTELAPVAALSELVWLDINHTQAGDASLAHLAGLKKHERHQELLEWIGGGFDSEDFDPAAATKAMKKGLPDWRSMR